MTWVDMEQAIAQMMLAEQRLRLMTAVIMALMSGMWLVIAMLEQRTYRIRHGVQPGPWYVWMNYAIAVFTFALAIAMWRMP